MNPWPVYSYMKMTWRKTGRIPTAREVARKFKTSTMLEKREGMIEFKIAYETTFSKERHVPEDLQRWNLEIESIMKELGNQPII
jgi:hypothetical protein